MPEIRVYRMLVYQKQSGKPAPCVDPRGPARWGPPRDKAAGLAMGRPDNYFHTSDILDIPFVANHAHHPNEGKMAKKGSIHFGDKTRKYALCKEIDSIFRIITIMRNIEERPYIRARQRKITIKRQQKYNKWRCVT